MDSKATGRRSFLKQAGLMGSMAMIAGLPEVAMAGGAGSIREETLAAQEPEPPKYHIKFAVCGMSHDHIYGMIGRGRARRRRTGSGMGRRAGQAGGVSEALPACEDREDAGGDSRTIPRCSWC